MELNAQEQMKSRRRRHAILVWAALPLLAAFSSHASVYATNIKLNGSLTNQWIAPGYPARISYVLNEPATAGVIVRVCQGTNVVKTFSAAGGQPGALPGTNSFLWDGTSNGTNVPPGACSIHVTAGAVGYSTWTGITSDGPGFFVNSPRGVDVNKNTNSPYFGRVFVANAYAGNGQGAGIFKFNADGSPADEGGYSDGGYPWAGDQYSPWKIAVGADDAVNVNDWRAGSPGAVVQFDQLISPNPSYVLWSGYEQFPAGSVDASGPYLSGPETNELLWMADAHTNGSYGILQWRMDTNGFVAIGDMGATAVAATNSDLTAQPYDVAISTNGFIYTIQSLSDPFSSDNRVLCFPPWTNGQPSETSALWAVGSGDTNLTYAYGVDVNPANTLVAVASRGYGRDPSALVGGNVSIFSTPNGSLVKRLGMGANHQYTDVAWDAVGNLYALDGTASMWRAYSPPGTNQATTVAVQQLQDFSALLAPQLSQPAMSNQFTFLLCGQPYVTYAVQVSPDFVAWSTIATNYDSVSNRVISLPLPSDPQDFYRATVLFPN